MSDAPNNSRWGRVREAVKDPRVMMAIVLGLIVGTLGAIAGYTFWLAPQKELALLRFNTARDVMALYGMEMEYKRGHGTFANGLDVLLAASADGAAFKEGMADHIDMATIAVVGDAEHFKIEANVLDKDRTLIKVRGPIEDHPAFREPVRALPQASETEGTGAPLSGPVNAPPAAR